MRKEVLGHLVREREARLLGAHPHDPEERGQPAARGLGPGRGRACPEGLRPRLAGTPPRVRPAPGRQRRAGGRAVAGRPVAGRASPKVGFLSVRDLLHEWVHHDRNHIRQMLANVQAFAWPHMGNGQRFFTTTPS